MIRRLDCQRFKGIPRVRECVRWKELARRSFGCRGCGIGHVGRELVELMLANNMRVYICGISIERASITPSVPT
ncbi:MAG: hypothetical protein H6617_03700 [Bdellovibrionaceae bacterium]|nr:hypothetical protein [Pseudobdellovibrionaceae bacterium]